MSEKLLIERLKSLAVEVRGPVKEALLDAAMALSEADAQADWTKTVEDHDEKMTDQCNALRSRLAEAERNEGTLLGMIRHQRDVLRECLPYLNESMAGKRPGRSADDIRAAVKALTSASADGPKGEK
jgi:hypothetical protein